MTNRIKVSRWRTAPSFWGVVTSLIITQCSLAQDDVRNSLVSEVNFGLFKMFVHPSYDLAKVGFGFSAYSFHEESHDDAKQKTLVGWTSKDVTIIAIDRHLLVGSRYFQIPESCKEVWLIDGLLVGPGSGLIAETHPPISLLNDIEAEREDYTQLVSGVKFSVKKTLIQGGSFRFSDEKNYSAIVGGCFFLVVDGNLEFRGKNYGRVGSGDSVVVDENGALSINRSGPDSKSEPGVPPKVDPLLMRVGGVASVC